MSFYDPKIWQTQNLKQGVPHLLYKNLYLPETNGHIFVKFLVYPIKFD